ncbi:PE family protein [Amycolatopsis marina]|uniref:PE family protein n=1 Tax=Amycolatopsis marina TaxID=490629 RepID=A0A1I0VI51_9PSEU|nr:PE domain-containing protein [Amycolatopsis marina]SFA76169.1 PE family protein [Amycolatopsis marina]
MTDSAVQSGSALSTYALGASVPAVPGARDIQVEPDKLLEVAGVLEAQANELQDRVRAQLGALRIAPPSEDIVSRNAIEAWNSVVVDGEESYEGRVRAYIEGLRVLVEQLRAASAAYEAGEDDKAESFGDRRDPGA